MNIIETTRLNVRQFITTDFEALCDLLGDIETMRYIGPRRPMSDSEIMEWLKNQIANQKIGINRYVVSLKESNELIGVCGLQQLDGIFDFGYYFRRKYWGNGYAFESCREIIAYIETKFEIMSYQIFVTQSNSASCRLMAKLDFYPETLTEKNGEIGCYYKPCAAIK